MMRYIRKILFCAALAAPGFHLQIIPILSLNIFFTIFLAYLRPHSRTGNNLFIISNEAVLVLLQILFVVYDSKSKNTVLSTD
jgi:hypothetical protein